jgi:C_GCAxxG_C_C family probable redox protein
MDYEYRINKSVEYFKKGFNCAQSVVAAFADIYGYTEEQAMTLSAGFGGGIGRMRGPCGAACGMFILAGMDCGTADASDRDAKSHNYAVVQQLAEKFKKECGSIICAELLGLKKDTPLSSMASERTPQYYTKRPCAEMVRMASRIFSEYLENKDKQPEQ